MAPRYCLYQGTFPISLMVALAVLAEQPESIVLGVEFLVWLLFNEGGGHLFIINRPGVATD